MTGIIIILIATVAAIIGVYHLIMVSFRQLSKAEEREATIWTLGSFGVALILFLVGESLL